MNIVEIISELKNERTRIDRAIAALNGSSSNGATKNPIHQQPSASTQGRSQMSAEARQQISLTMKKRRKKASAKK